MAKAKKSSIKDIIRNAIWVLALNIREVPFITFSRIVGFINNYGSSLLRAFVIALIINWTSEYITSSEKNNILLYYSLASFAGFYLITGFASVLRNYGENLSGFKLNYEIPNRMLHEKLNALSITTLENPEFQNKLNLYNEASHSIDDASNRLLSLIGMIITLLFAIIPLFLAIPIPTILIILASIPSLFSNKWAIEKLWKIRKETTVISRKSSDMIGMITTPEALKEIRLLNAYDYLKKYFDSYVETYFGKKLKVYQKWSLFDIANTLLSGIVILYAMFQLVTLAGEGKINVGEIVFYISAFTTVVSYIDSFSTHVSSYLGGNLQITEIRELLEYKEKRKAGEKEIELLQKPPQISLKNVSFRYSGSKKSVIKNLNLEIKPGEKIAIVGENGAGKTTLVKLISNIYQAQKGEILVNGENLKNIKPESWFQNLGVLYQDYNTYNALSAKENIALGRITEEVNQEKLEDAAKKADAYNFIMNFDNKFDQILSELYEGGTRPSTGQWQKISIARFFYRNAPVLILDEPTASIDAVAEANIFDRIYSFIQDKTVIIISHRFSTVRNADRIIVFDKGQIVEQGSHEELLAQNGTYANAFRLQAKGYKE